MSKGLSRASGTRRGSSYLLVPELLEPLGLLELLGLFLAEELEPLDWSESIKALQRNWIGRSEGAEIDFYVSVRGTADLAKGFKQWQAVRAGSGFPVEPGEDVAGRTVQVANQDRVALADVGAAADLADHEWRRLPGCHDDPRLDAQARDGHGARWARAGLRGDQRGARLANRGTARQLDAELRGE